MTPLIVPQSVSASDALVWVGICNEPNLPTTITIGPDARRISLQGGWQQWNSNAASLSYQRIRVPNLQPRRSYTLAFDSQPPSATFVTLPDSLPSTDDRPFTVLLGSCFCAAKDESGAFGNTYFHLPSDARPDVKIFCGDQVYLDSPWYEFLAHTHSRSQMESEFLGRYLGAWTQGDNSSGYYSVLTDGANFLSSDDHEFWNNAPSAAIYVRDTWTQSGRKTWWSVAEGLYRAFQSADDVPRISVPPLSILSIDTRIHRRPDRTTFLNPTDYRAVEDWVRSLSGPGALVIGQPIFDKPVGWLHGHIADWSLPDYAQYAGLVRLLLNTKHSIVILTGDVHFSRVAHCTLDNGAQLVEVISSPTSLVDTNAGGKWSPAPDRFPAAEIPGVAPSRVETVDWKSTANSFMTLEFASAGDAVRMNIRYWPVGHAPGAPIDETVYTVKLK